MGEDSQSERSEFTDITGCHFPPRASIGERVQSLFKREQFWTPQRENLGERVVTAVNEELSPFSCPKLKFNKRQIKLKEELEYGGPEMIWPLGEKGKAFPGQIDLDLNQVVENENLVYILTHAFLHHNSLLLFRSLNSKTFMRRMGFHLVETPSKKRPEQEVKILDQGCRELDEAIIDATVEKIMKKHFPELNILSILTVIRRRSIFDALILATARSSEQSNEEVFYLFQQATFGKGRLLPLVRTIENVYGGDSFMKVIHLVGQIPKTPPTPEAPFGMLDLESKEANAYFSFIEDIHLGGVPGRTPRQTW